MTARIFRSLFPEHALLRAPLGLENMRSAEISLIDDQSHKLWQKAERESAILDVVITVTRKADKTMEQAIFAAGCFWGVQYYFDQVPGVKNTIVGYTGGTTEDPTYEEVCTHTTGHAEAILIEFDADEVSYKTLLKQFFRMHDPTQLNRQGPDVGDNYRSAIFYVTDAQRDVAEAVKAGLQSKFDGQIVTEITQAGPFYRAEDYYQKYTDKTGRGACHVDYAPV